MKGLNILLLILFLPLFANAARPVDHDLEVNTQNAGMYRYDGCADIGPLTFGAVLAAGALGRRRHR